MGLHIGWTAWNRGRGLVAWNGWGGARLTHFVRHGFAECACLFLRGLGWVAWDLVEREESVLVLPTTRVACVSG